MSPFDISSTRAAGDKELVADALLLERRSELFLPAQELGSGRVHREPQRRLGVADRVVHVAPRHPLDDDQRRFLLPWAELGYLGCQRRDNLTRCVVLLAIQAVLPGVEFADFVQLTLVEVGLSERLRARILQGRVASGFV